MKSKSFVVNPSPLPKCCGLDPRQDSICGCCAVSLRCYDEYTSNPVFHIQESDIDESTGRFKDGSRAQALAKALKPVFLAREQIVEASLRVLGSVIPIEDFLQKTERMGLLQTYKGMVYGEILLYRIKKG